MRFARSVVAAAVLLGAVSAWGQTWVEVGDAPALPGGQVTEGPTTLTAIQGTLSSGDDVDLYAIQIVDTNAFSVASCNGTSIDSTLYLFDLNGYGIAMSEDAGACSPQSQITSQFVHETGIYFVAMSAFDFDPQNSAEEDIWNDTPYGEERAPDGPGAAGALAGWAGNPGGSGPYTLTLTGAEFVLYAPPPATGGCCYGDGACQVTTEANCISTLGGSYQGDDTECGSITCPAPVTGSCCFFTNGCLALTETECLANSGEYGGDGTMCWPNPCGTNGEPPTGGWTEGFDDYTNGTVLYNVGGWSGWDDNPAAAGIVSDQMYRSAPNAIMLNDTSDAVRPFDGFEGGQWVITAWQYLPSNLSGTSYFVVNSYYEPNGAQYWAVEIQFDPATGLVHDQIRDSEKTSTLPIVYDQWVEIRIEADLTGGLGTIDEYYNGQLLFSGAWIAGSIGQLNIGAIDLYTPHVEPAFYDDLSILPNESGEEPGTPVRPLFAGVLYGDEYAKTTNLEGMPDVTWNNGFLFAVDGAAGRLDGSLYLTSGSSFASDLYIAPIEGPAIQISSLDVGISGLAYGRNRLFGYSNSSPPSIYEIIPSTGDKFTLTQTGSYKFFGLDYNPVDDKLYGYTEYGSPTGLYSIDIDTGAMTHIAAKVPSENSAARGLACGDNKVYALTVYGEYPMYEYDLAQGTGGVWAPLTHPFPESNSTGGLAWTAGPAPGDLNIDGDIDLADAAIFVDCLTGPDVDPLTGCAIADLSGDGDVDLEDFALMSVPLSK